MSSRRRLGRAEVRTPSRASEPDRFNTLELVGVTVDPGGSAVLCYAPQLYSGFPLSRTRELTSSAARSSR